MPGNQPRCCSAEWILGPVQGPHHRQDMRRVGALAASGVDQVTVAAPREQRIEQERLRRVCDAARAKFAEDRRIESRVRQFQAQHICPIDAAAHRIRGLAIREPLRELQDGDQRQPLRGARGLSVRGEQSPQRPDP